MVALGVGGWLEEGGCSFKMAMKRDNMHLTMLCDQSLSA